jgi:hypothetical protein
MLIIPYAMFDPTVRKDLLPSPGNAKAIYIIDWGWEESTGKLSTIRPTLG